ncbi:MAG: SDR family oxidoreductase [Nitrospinaceae bacterium]
MDVDLTGRKVAITGVGDGIGRSLALAFGLAGARVAGCARSRNRLDAVSSEIEGGGHLFHPADLTRPGELNDFYEKTAEAFGGLDVLVNNVGAILKLGNFFDLTDQDWQDSFDVNLMPAVRLSRLFIPQLRRSPAPRIINISSVAAIRPGEPFPQYSAMKAGLSNLTVSLAKTLAPDKIIVNSVSPGPVWTRSWENEAEAAAEESGEPLSKVKKDIQSSTAQTVLLERMGVPEDVTGIVLFLASDSARWITATNFTVDGGII